jgi:hypothetical protein
LWELIVFRNHSLIWHILIWCNIANGNNEKCHITVWYYVFESLQWKRSNAWLISNHTQFSCLCFCFSFDRYEASSFIIRCITSIFYVFSIIHFEVADDGSKQRYINNENWSDGKHEFRKIFFFPKNTSSHAKFPAAILKNPYYTPCNTAHISTPPM